MPGTVQGPRDASDGPTSKGPRSPDAPCWGRDMGHRNKQQGCPAVTGTESGRAREDLFEKVPSQLRPAWQKGKDEPAMRALGKSVAGRELWDGWAWSRGRVQSTSRGRVCRSEGAAGGPEARGLGAMKHSTAHTTSTPPSSTGGSWQPKLMLHQKRHRQKKTGVGPSHHHPLPALSSQCHSHWVPVCKGASLFLTCPYISIR